MLMLHTNIKLLDKFYRRKQLLINRKKIYFTQKIITIFISITNNSLLKFSYKRIKELKVWKIQENISYCIYHIVKYEFKTTNEIATWKKDERNSKKNKKLILKIRKEAKSGF